MHRRLLLAAALGVAFLAFAAGVRAADAVVTVTGCDASAWQFSPRSVTVDVGDSVTFSNPAAASGCVDAPHTATATGSSPAWDSGDVPVGASEEVAMDSAGTFSYRCAYHGWMGGTVVVRALEADVPPTVAIASPADGALVEPGIVRIEGTASSDASSVSLVIDGGAPVAVAGTTSWAYAWDTSGLAPGSAHTLEAIASDGRNLGESDPVRVTIARADAGPKVAIYAPRPSDVVSGIVLVNGTAADDRGLERVEVSVDGVAWRLATGTHAWRFAWDTREVPDGVRVLEVRARDNGGNVGFAPSVAVTVRNAVVDDAPTQEPPSTARENRPPVFGVPIPGEGATVTGTVRFRVPASDPDGDALTVQLRIDGALVLTSAPPLVYAWQADLADPGRHVVAALACDDDACSRLAWNLTVAGEAVREADADEGPVGATPAPRPTPTAKRDAPTSFLLGVGVAVLAAAAQRRRQEPGA